ncbi:hypothetical protein C7M84_014700 [Penaeus vannamei]|uniref:Uncharacterized protein n=1 Tax=Penaeus vannamei TaxID=6689 RepID=A0A3R7Q311_PENVA|nr:hypothetical protein C7M84_014700 [Penaeus vannamei]
MFQKPSLLPQHLHVPVADTQLRVPRSHVARALVQGAAAARRQLDPAPGPESGHSAQKTAQEISSATATNLTIIPPPRRNQMSFYFRTDKPGYESCLMYDYNYTLRNDPGTQGSRFWGSYETLSCSSRDFNYTQYESTVVTELRAAARGADLRLVVPAGFATALSPCYEAYFLLLTVVACLLYGAYLGCFVIVMEVSAPRQRSSAGSPVRPLGRWLHDHARHRLPGAHLAWMRAALTLPMAPSSSTLVSLPRCQCSCVVSLSRLTPWARRSIPRARRSNDVSQSLPPAQVAARDAAVAGAEGALPGGRCGCSRGRPASMSAPSRPPRFFLKTWRQSEIRPWPRPKRRASRAARRPCSLTAPPLRRTTACTLFCWIAASLVYDGVSLNAANLRWVLRSNLVFGKYFVIQGIRTLSAKETNSCRSRWTTPLPPPPCRRCPSCSQVFLDAFRTLFNY